MIKEESNMVSFQTMSKSSFNVQSTENTKEIVPEYKQIIPKNENSEFVIGINPEFLKDATTIIDNFQADKYKLCYMHIYKDRIKLRAYNKETKQKIQTIIMCMGKPSSNNPFEQEDTNKLDNMCEEINKLRNKKQGDSGYICAHYHFQPRNILINRVLPSDDERVSECMFETESMRKATQYLKNILAILKD